MKIFLSLSFVLFLGSILVCNSCSKTSYPSLKIAATSIPHVEILEYIKPYLQKHNIDLQILVIDDFNTPNRALADREIDANFFQHLPFLEIQNADFGYKLESLTAVHLEPMALYSNKHSYLNDIKDGAIIAVPNDSSNQTRALALCEKIGWITLKNNVRQASIFDIQSNPYQLQFLEMDSAMLSRTLEDVDAAFITTNFALIAGLSPNHDALAIEDAKSDYVNLVVIRQGDVERREIQTLKESLASPDVREFINKQYQGAVIPAF